MTVANLHSGKTYCLTYLLLARLIAAKPTVFVSQTNCCYIFKDDGVYACSEAELADADDDDYTKDALYLVDLNERRSSVTNFPNRRMVVSERDVVEREGGDALNHEFMVVD